MMLFYLSKKEYLELNGKNFIKKEDAIRASVDILNHITKSKVAVATGLKKELMRFLKRAPIAGNNKLLLMLIILLMIIIVKEEMLACINEYGTQNTIKLITTLSATNDTDNTSNNDININNTK